MITVRNVLHVSGMVILVGKMAKTERRKNEEKRSKHGFDIKNDTCSISSFPDHLLAALLIPKT
jgi:hypothetical protein